MSFWNSLCDLPDDNLYRQVAMDDISDAKTRHIRNWAWSFRYNLREVGYEFASTGLLPVCLKAVLQLLDAPTAQLWHTLYICPRTCPSQDATLCTYLRWFTKPSGLSRSVSLLQLPLSACCLGILLRFRMECHSLPIVCGERSGIPRPQRLCPHCASQAVRDERHMVFECEELQRTRDNCADLFGPSMRLEGPSSVPPLPLRVFAGQCCDVRVLHPYSVAAIYRLIYSMGSAGACPSNTCVAGTLSPLLLPC